MNDKTKKRLFGNFLINPQYQIKYVFFLSLSGLLLTVLYSSLTYYYVRENYSVFMELVPMTDDAKSQLISELRHLVAWIFLTSVGFIGIISFIGIVISHRTAGPLYHFRKVFDEIKSGNHMARVNLRKKDDFKDVALAFNEMMDNLQPKGSKPDQK